MNSYGFGPDPPPPTNWLFSTDAMTPIAGGQYHVLAYDPAGTFATSFYADAESFETSKVLALTSILTMSNVNFTSSFTFIIRPATDTCFSW